MSIPARFIVSDHEHWRANHRIDTALPGYLMLAAKHDADDLSLLPQAALVELGPLLARLQAALRTMFAPTRIYVGRYGHSRGHPIHFHVIPVHHWVERLFWQDDRYRALQQFAGPTRETLTDGAELTLFIWRELCERPGPSDIKGPTVDETIALLRRELASG